MKILLRILLGLGALVVLLLVIALFVKKDYRVQRTVSIERPREAVFAYVRQLKNGDHYNKWIMTDPQARKTYEGHDGTPGFTYAWDSRNKNVGAGRQRIENIVENERIDLSIHFIRPFESQASASMTTEAETEARTRLTWAMEGRNPYPLNLMNLFIGSMLGGDMETSLQTLKTQVEHTSTNPK